MRRQVGLHVVLGIAVGAAGLANYGLLFSNHP